MRHVRWTLAELCWEFWRGRWASVCVRLWGGPGCIEVGFPSRSSLSASRHQVEYLYSLVYQALDFISGKK